MIDAGVEVIVGGGRRMLRFLTPIPALSKGLPLLLDDEKDPYVSRRVVPTDFDAAAP